jgi:hypothetical protein
MPGDSKFIFVRHHSAAARSLAATVAASRASQRRQVASPTPSTSSSSSGGCTISSEDDIEQFFDPRSAQTLVKARKLSTSLRWFVHGQEVLSRDTVLQIKALRPAMSVRLLPQSIAKSPLDPFMQVRTQLIEGCEKDALVEHVNEVLKRLRPSPGSTFWCNG